MSLRNGGGRMEVRLLDKKSAMLSIAHHMLALGMFLVQKQSEEDSG